MLHGKLNKDRLPKLRGSFGTARRYRIHLAIFCCLVAVGACAAVLLANTHVLHPYRHIGRRLVSVEEKCPESYWRVHTFCLPKLFRNPDDQQDRVRTYAQIDAQIEKLWTPRSVGTLADSANPKEDNIDVAPSNMVQDDIGIATIEDLHMAMRIVRTPGATSAHEAASPEDAIGGPTASDYSFGFKTHPFGSLTMETIRNRTCEGEDLTTHRSIDPRLKVLFILGTQKGGTTYLFRALEGHDAFVAADRPYMQTRVDGGWNKEIHYFDRFPPPPGNYLSCFHSKYTDLPPHWKAADVNYTLVDGTPDYMFNPMAPPRIKALIPQARFVVVLRDPVARAYSAWKMSQTSFCDPGKQNDPVAEARCRRVSTFENMVRWDIMSERTVNCLFDHPGGSKDWLDCNKYKNSHKDLDKCKPEHQRICYSRNGFTTVGVSNYAAQLSLWLSFFPPDRFLILTSNELRDPTKQLVAMNKLMQHAGLSGRPFVHEAIKDVVGFDGKALHVSESDRRGFQLMRETFTQATRDLDQLLRSAGIEFNGIPEENPV